ncbi:ImmA/IrrE family metallo-endopeptidase [Dorea formicigenerans]|uniref:ImmA/IrrE family metallo-endopeptidase n=1 Tax=Dorea formicigenerans TaxID=39486 RepID=UPI0035639B7C
MTYEELLIEHDSLNILELDLSEVSGLKGLYYNGSVAIEQQLTSVEKTCVLAEELGHHYTSVGNILDMDISANRKQERQARLHGYNRLIGLTGLIRAYEHGCTNRYETAEYLEVTEEFLEECISCYREKYGVYKIVDNYIIYFIPNLAVFKRI